MTRGCGRDKHNETRLELQTSREELKETQRLLSGVDQGATTKQWQELNEEHREAMNELRGLRRAHKQLESAHRTAMMKLKASGACSM